MFNVKARQSSRLARPIIMYVKKKESLPSVFSGWGPSPPRTVGPH